MALRNIGVLAVLLAASGLAAAARAQDGTSGPPDPAEQAPAWFKAFQDDFNGRLSILEAKMEELVPRSSQPMPPAEGGDDGAVADGAAGDEAGELRRRIDEQLEPRITQLEGQVFELQQQLRDISREVATDRYTPNILGNVQDNRDFDDEMRRTVQGRLVFRNSLGYEPLLFVNGSQWRVLPGTSHIYVPRAKVVLQLPGQQPQVFEDWKLNGDQHELLVNINP